MKLGIIGLPQCGKKTMFSALTGARGEKSAARPTRTEGMIGTVRVSDERVDDLQQIYQPKKVTYAQVEYLLPSDIAGGLAGKSESALWNQIRTSDALIHVVRNFEGPAGLPPSPEEDFWRLEEDMIINDLAVVEKKIQRIELDLKRGNKSEQDLQPALQSCLQMLEDNRPIRLNPDLAADPALRGFTFLSAKPQLVIVNNDDDDESLPPWKKEPDRVDMILVRGRLEMDIAAMSQEEAEEFLEAYHIETSALDRVIQKSYELLELISFFTVLNQEVRAWTLKKGLPALEAAGTVHSDMKQGFIRAEVLSYEDLKKHGSFREAKKVGKVRLEGKDYTVLDGDIINFRFNV